MKRGPRNVRMEENKEKITRAEHIAKNHTPPVYLREFVAKSAEKGPAGILTDGRWCGHGELLWNIFSIVGYKNPTFFIHLSKQDFSRAPHVFVIPRVEIAHVDAPNKWLTIYDARFHPSSPFAYNRVSRKYVVEMQDSFLCPQCRNMKFHLALGFEIPKTCETPNDLSWFALAAECVSCAWKQIIFQDEIAKHETPPPR